MRNNVWKIHFLAWTNGIVVLLILAWMLFAFRTNRIFTKYVSEAQVFVDTISGNVPENRTNSSVLELKALVADLGIDWENNVDPDSDVSISQQGGVLWQNAYSQIANYVHYVYASNPEGYGSRENPDRVADLFFPEIEDRSEAQSYIVLNRETLSNIRDLTSESQETDSRMFDANLDYTNRRTINTLVNVVMFEILYSLYRQESDSQDLTMANLQLIGQLYADIDTQSSRLVSFQMYSDLDRTLVQFIRNLDDLPDDWDDRLPFLKLDRQALFLESLKLDVARYIYSLDNPNTEESSNNALERFLFAVRKPYLSWIAMDVWKTRNRIDDRLQNTDFCTVDPETLKTYNNPDLQLSGWNPYGDTTIVSWLEMGELELQWELTEKVQQVKAVARKQEKFPDTIPGIETSMCEESRWNYQVNADGTATVSLENIPPALKLSRRDVSWTYTIALPSSTVN